MYYIETLMRQKHMTRSMLCRRSLVPESTLRDILSGKTNIAHCEALTLARIADTLDTTVEEILRHSLQERQAAKKAERPQQHAQPLIWLGDADIQDFLYQLLCELRKDDSSWNG